MPNYQGVWSLSEQYQNASGWPLPPLGQDNAFFFGGTTATNPETINFVSFASTGNASDFGDLITPYDALAASGSATRVIISGGDSGLSSTVIQYFDPTSFGNSADFGDLLFSLRFGASCANSTRCVTGGGSGGNANVMQYVAIASTGNASDFGDLTVVRDTLGGSSNSTRALFHGGIVYSGEFVFYNTIDYITIASTGNATDFGDMTAQKSGTTSASSNSRCIISEGNGSSGGAAGNVLTYVEIASTGNATDFGDLTYSTIQGGAYSNAHGGLS